MNKKYVRLEFYNSRWVASYTQEANKLAKLMGNKFSFSIEHVGSTALLGCYSRHAIDLVVGVRDVKELVTLKNFLVGKGMQVWSRHSTLEHTILLDKKKDVVEFEIHLVVKGFNDWNLLINFRNYMNEHPNLIKDYSNFKRKLADELRVNFSTYYLSKDNFKKEILGIK